MNARSKGRSTDNLSCLIVCSDARATELAAVLAPAFAIYCRWRDSLTWQTLAYYEGAWREVDGDISRADFDVLFFHTGGNGDPSGIPQHSRFKKEFAFSGGGLSAANAPAGREAAIPIRRRFMQLHCPVRSRHVAELVAFVQNERNEIPSFCRVEQGLPTVVSIAILCQIFGIAGMIEGHVKQAGGLARAIGWDRFSSIAASPVADRLRALWPSLCAAAWWQESMGIASKTRARELFALNLASDLDVGSEEGVRAACQAGEVITDAAVRLIRRTYPGIGALAEAVLGGSVVGSAEVTKCYTEIAAVLHER